MTRTGKGRWWWWSRSSRSRGALASIVGAAVLGVGASTEASDWIVGGIAYSATGSGNGGKGTVRAALPLDTSTLRPNIRWNLPPAIAQRLQQAFPIAVRRVRNEAACRALFDALGVDGAEKLAGTLYYGTKSKHASQVCRFGAMALTSVGSSVTWLCPVFAKLPSERAALALIHEALHFAGLPERPWDPDAMSSTEINDLVKQRCAP